jgi:hypothetical protein
MGRGSRDGAEVEEVGRGGMGKDTESNVRGFRSMGSIRTFLHASRKLGDRISASSSPSSIFGTSTGQPSRTSTS